MSDDDLLTDEVEAVLAAAVQWKTCRGTEHQSQAEAALSAAVTAYAKKYIYPEGEPT